LELNADFSRHVAVHAARLPWVASPMAGLGRRILDRIGDEVARAACIVRYAPGATPGCILFVKLWQFDLSDRVQVRFDTGPML
jgi:hypothetical protein